MFTEKRTTFISEQLYLDLHRIGFDWNNLFQIEKKKLVNNLDTENKYHLEKLFAYHKMVEEFDTPSYDQVFSWFRQQGVFGIPQLHYNGKNYDSYEYVIIYNKEGNDYEEVIFGKQFSEYWEAREECILEMIQIYKEEFL